MTEPRPAGDAAESTPPPDPAQDERPAAARGAGDAGGAGDEEQRPARKLPALPSPRRAPGREEALNDDTEDGERSFREQVEADDRERRLRHESLDGLSGGRTRNRTSVDGDGNTVWSAGGSINYTVMGDAGGTRPQAPRLPKGPAHRLFYSMVVGESARRVGEALNSRSLVVLRGKPGSGRRAAATYAFLASDPRLREMLDAPGTTDEALDVAQLLLRGDPLALRSEDLQKGMRYVLDASDEDWARGDAVDVLAHLGDLAYNAHCSLVVLVSADSLAGERPIVHEPPEAREVFRRHLEYLLPRDDAARRWARRVGESPELEERLPPDAPPASAARMAESACEGYRKGGAAADVAACLDDHSERVVAEVRTKLRNDSTTLRERCFLIAAAVLNGLSTVLVTRAALALADRIDGGHPHEEAAIPSWEQLSTWLRFAGAKASPAGRGGEGRVVELDTGMRRAVLEVVWEDHPPIREALLAWLDDLSRHRSQAVRIRTAHAVGRLATFNFGVIESEFLRPWTEDRSVRKHQLAAWALEAASLDQEVEGRVRGLLGRWSRGSIPKRSAAARAYGSKTIGMRWPSDALEAFDGISKVVRTPALQAAVARSITDLFTGGNEEEILRLLYTWSVGAVPTQRRTAALAFVRLATRLESREERTGMIDLQDRTDLAEYLVELWRNALSGGVALTPGRRSLRGGPGNAAWDALAAWILRWDSAPGLRAVIEGVFSLKGDYPELRAPLNVHLRIWHHQMPDRIHRPLARHLAGLLETS